MQISGPFHRCYDHNRSNHPAKAAVGRMYRKGGGLMLQALNDPRRVAVNPSGRCWNLENPNSDNAARTGSVSCAPMTVSTVYGVRCVCRIRAVVEVDHT
jgi:hypothetical protein